ncbi:hypothetical protein [Mesorhizobium sp. 131-2-1]|uniref:hypothetical protein n=1 Tax=Mesorhizobium sp. 131-2-1 TaxID=2744518 RepID=UPI0019266967|nr:hypothetical protein [Mesorhizobium sp. 131-2-1]
MSLPPVLGAPLRRDNHFEHSYFYLKNISTGFSALPGGIKSMSAGQRPLCPAGHLPHKGEIDSRHCLRQLSTLQE